MENLIQQNFGTVLLIVFSIIVVGSIVIIKLLTSKKHSAVYKANVTDTKKRVTPKPGRRVYEFANGIEAYQEELTWDQDVEAFKIIKSFGIDSIIEKSKESGFLPVDDLLDILTEHNALDRFLCAIMHVTHRPYAASWGKLHNSELRVVFTDFFTLNPEAKIVLGSFRFAAAIMQTTDSQKSSTTTSSTTS